MRIAEMVQHKVQQSYFKEVFFKNQYINAPVPAPKRDPKQVPASRSPRISLGQRPIVDVTL
jgi:hypothetical protein